MMDTNTRASPAGDRLTVRCAPHPQGTDMLIIYDSLTGNAQRFAHTVAERTQRLARRVTDPPPDGPYLLVTYTFGQGQVPPSTATFLAAHSAHLRGVVASGSYHWGANFARAGDLIAQAHGVPLIAKLNKGGAATDVDTVTAWLRAHDPLTHRSPHGPLD
ncbi:class Ib ribonucleoside-diphosphate reductase assembly flavoprotein NrdI [Deinococcus soli (ex Cha et al. 2016)]|uniref:Protein involved in ribonucleotide reduction n=2 Tax=Deinococcus soli (ex Cha et al. 2016) TaxID=1309411 RepID=A0ACC6KFF6_9DEIO|nr:class Ib ribonucleoside-diphosphate reductase assembly flavoprotein NrdI [Deinococcus soli (ex Cha et al. 2016)]MDR6218245.1 protein involved in ribonucleotide reduction [Deinococcus soli (ex Cha et al. 2016)]MDR6328985.1 protein involved in ribonucleotide reduction [Deinococcus soli (ex Cha et al. 2016)]MDR6751258.1 protein involved in ribonucleotide reduction [Deinococcus soli (ex Cha et al. 2016)]